MDRQAWTIVLIALVLVAVIALLSGCASRTNGWHGTAITTRCTALHATTFCTTKKGNRPVGYASFPKY